MMFRKNQRRRQRQNGTNSATAAAAVGTEAVAAANRERNARNFRYPESGFATPIEQTLLYAMLSEPSIYPEPVVRKEVDSEDFADYLEVNPPKGTPLGQESDLASYAQLSALLALGAEKFPAQSSSNKTTTTSRTRNPWQREDKDLSIAEALGKAVMRTVVRYADQHDLDREAEIRELMDPVQRYIQRHVDKAEMKEAIPFYVGYTASLLTANPLFIVVGAAVTVRNSNPAVKDERENASNLAAEASRRGDAEKTSLLDEIECD